MSTKQKHTPGPWTADTVVVASKTHGNIAECFRGNSLNNIKTEAEALANTALIAAAPDLLAALKLCLYDDAGGLEVSTVAQAMNAIEKATGGSNE